MQQNRDGVVKLFSLFGRFSILLLFAAASGYAQSFADFKRVQSESFANFRDKKDSEFSNYIKRQWQEYEAQYTKPMYKKQKPKTIVPASRKKFKAVGPKIRINLQKPPKHAEHILPIPVYVKKGINFDFFGTKIGVDIPLKMKQAKFYPNNQQGIVNFFSVMASSDYDGLLDTIKTIQKELNLNDWGINVFVKELSKNIFLNNDDATLFRWFILNKLSYDVRVALSGGHTLLLQSSKQIIYATPTYTLDSKKYYLIDNYNKESVGRIYTYERNYPDADKKLDFSLKTLPNFSRDELVKNLRYKYFGKEYKISYHLNKNLLAFMDTYPQVDYKVYFNAPLETSTYLELAKSLKVYLEGKKASEAINILLHFVQKAFDYESDQEQFGHEKVMFAEQTLYYKKSDCEDRAVLFAYLVKKMLHISVVGVKYSDHMSTALYIPLRGDSVKVGRKKFIIADPTYINANVGQSMQKYRSIIPEKFIYVRNI